MTSWKSLATRKSRVTAAVSALALSWWSSRLQIHIHGHRLHHAWKILVKQWLIYQSAVTIFLSSFGMVATWPNFAKKHTIICLESLLFFWFSQVGSHLGRPAPPTLLCFSVVLVYPGFVSCYDDPKWGVLPLSNFLSMWVHQSTLPRICSSLSLWGTQRAQCFLTPRQSWRIRVRLPD